MRLIPILLITLWSAGAAGQPTGNLVKPHTDQPFSMVRNPSGNWFADFGTTAFGKLTLRISVQQKDTLWVRLAEKAAGLHTVDSQPGGTIRFQEIRVPVSPDQAEYQVEIKPYPRNTNPPAILLSQSIGVILPFRYAEVVPPRNSFSNLNLTRTSYYVPFNDSASRFISSDTVLNRVWDLCKHSIKVTTYCGLYVDGDRERIPYEADALINQLGHYSLDTEYRVARHTNEYFIDHPTWPTEWILHTVPLFYNDFMYTGDPEPLIRNWDALVRKTLISLDRGDGLITTHTPRVDGTFMQSIGFADTSQRIRDIVDWPAGERDGYEMVAVNTVVNAFYYWNLTLMSELAGWLGKKKEAKEFSERAKRTRLAFNRAFLDPGRGIYTDGEGSLHHSLHANLFALRFGLVPEENRSEVIRFIKSRGMACSVYPAQYLIEALIDAGEEDYALSLMTSTDERSWYNMIRSGSGITLEAWDMKYKPNADWNHAWGAAPANLIPRYVWGIRPVEPGYRRVMIKPNLGSLTHSEIRIPTPYGPIEAKYQATPGKTPEMSVKLPKGIRKVSDR